MIAIASLRVSPDAPAMRARVRVRVRVMVVVKVRVRVRLESVARCACHQRGGKDGC